MEQETVSVSRFIDYIISGHSYCHIYKHNRRRKDCFLYTNIVSIDVDKTETSLCDFLATTDLKPTFAYETFSNGKDNCYSYRLVFIFEEKHIVNNEISERNSISFSVFDNSYNHNNNYNSTP